VGEWQQEEVNVVSLETGAGSNFGWHCFEGTFDYTSIQPNYDVHCGDEDDYEMPAFSYTNGPFLSGQPCSVIGGFVYRGSDFPELVGNYVFADFCDQSVRTLTPNSNGGWTFTNFGGRGEFFATFGEGPDGELYAGTWNAQGTNAAVYRVIVP
jgi:hypothetical protein